MEHEASRIRAGILSIVGAVSLFACMDALIKYLSADFHPLQIFFFRVLFGMLPLIPVLHTDGWRRSLRTHRLPLHVLRSVITMAAVVSFFIAFGLMPLADAYAISFAAPIFITLLAIPLLGERVGLRRSMAMAAGFVGVLVVLRPGYGLVSIGGLVMLGATVLYAVQTIIMRWMSRTESNGTIVLYFNLVAGTLSGLALPFVWSSPTIGQWGLLIAIGIIGGIGQLLITNAYRVAPAGVVSPFMYVQIVWGLGFGLVLFGDTPNAGTLAGAAIVIASGLYILRREAVLGREVTGKVGGT